MSDLILVVTHTAAFLAGGAVMRAWITRKVQVRDLENGHKALEFRHDDDDDDDD